MATTNDGSNMFGPVRLSPDVMQRYQAHAAAGREQAFRSFVAVSREPLVGIAEKVIQPPKKKPKKKVSSLPPKIRTVLRTFCQETETGVYKFDQRTFQSYMFNTSCYSIKTILALKLMLGLDISKVLKEYKKDPVKEVTKDYDSLLEAKKASFWAKKFSDKRMQKACAQMYTLTKENKDSECGPYSLLYLRALIRLENAELLESFSELIRNNSLYTSMRYLPLNALATILSQDPTEDEELFGRENVRWGPIQGIREEFEHRTKLSSILSFWSTLEKKRESKKKKETGNKALSYLLGQSADSEDSWEVTRKLQSTTGVFGKIDLYCFTALFVLNGIDLHTLYSVYLENPLEMGILLQALNSKDSSYKEEIYTRWAIEKNPETGLRRITRDGSIPKGLIRTKLDLLIKRQDSYGRWSYLSSNNIKMCPVLSEKELTLYADQGRTSLSNRRRGVLQKEMASSKIVFLSGWTPGGSTLSPPRRESNSKITTWHSKVTPKLLEDAGSTDLDSGLGVLVTPKRSFVRVKPWDKNVHPPYESRHIKDSFNQVISLRPASGAPVWLDKKKRVFESGGDASRYSFTHGSHNYKGLSVVGASAVGYKKDELAGWIRIRVSTEYSGGVLVIPDKDWDAMSFLFERGMFLIPQASEHQGLALDRVPSQNGDSHNYCFGGLEEQEPFTGARSNQACVAACLTFGSANVDLTKLGILGYAFPEGYIARGMSILKKKISKIPDHDIAVSMMSKVVLHEMGCVCVRYKKEGLEGVIAVPVLEDENWIWNEVGTFDCTDPHKSFPGSVLRPSGILNTSGLLDGRRPIGGYMTYDKQGIITGYTDRLCDYEKYLNAYKPLNLGISTRYDEDDIDYDEENYNSSNTCQTARTCSDKVLAGQYASKDGKTTFLEWRKL